MATKNAEIATMDTTLIPLNREELAIFYEASMVAQKDTLMQLMVVFKTAIQEQTEKTNALIRELKMERKEQADKISELTNKLIDSHNQINKAIMDSSTSMRKSMFAIASKPKDDAITVVAENPLFQSSINAGETNLWIKKSEGVIAQFVEKTKLPLGTVYSRIYDGMKCDGYDVIKLYTDYKKSHPQAKKINMCAASDTLRMSFEKNCNSFFVKNVKPKTPVETKQKKTWPRKKKGVYSIRVATTCPDNIRKIVKPLSKTGSVGGSTYRKAYGLFEKEYDVNLEAYRQSVMEHYNLPNCNIGFAISLDPSMTSKLRRAVKKNLGVL